MQPESTLPRSDCLASRWLFLINLLLATTVQAAAERIGERIYMEGLLPSGKPMQSITWGDVELTGTQVSCVSCHQRSGLGTSESRFQVPPITADLLFQRKEIGRTEKTLRKFKANKDNLIVGKRRPAYTEQTLRRAITTGIDPDGRQLDSLMPRYKLNEKELDHLIAYMRTLSREISPGVTDDLVHFATIIAGDVDKGQEQTMLTTMQRYFEQKNANTRNESGRATRGPWYKEPHYSAYRKWKLHIWRLTGPAETWTSQLATLYAKQAVFAVLSGIGAGDWSPVHNFCRANELPCLFPNVNFAGGSDTDYFTSYFFDGAEVEAKSLAKYLTSDSLDHHSARTIVQIHRTHGDSLAASKALEMTLKHKNRPITSISIPHDTILDAQFWKTLGEKYNNATFVIWLSSADLQHISSLTDRAKYVFFAGSLLAGGLHEIKKLASNNIYLTYPYELPSKQLLAKTLLWARLKKVFYTDKTVLGNTYFTVTLVTDIMKHLQNNLYRNYFIEKMEHMVDRMTTHSVFPRVSLAPGQRFASKGSYIVKLDPASKDGFAPVTGWLIP